MSVTIQGVESDLFNQINWLSHWERWSCLSALVTPHLQCCIHFWGPHCKTDVDSLKEGQTRNTKMLWDLEHLWREAERVGLVLPGQEGHLIVAFWYITGAWKEILPSTGRTRGNGFKLNEARFVLGIRKTFFTMIVMEQVVQTSCAPSSWEVFYGFVKAVILVMRYRWVWFSVSSQISCTVEWLPALNCLLFLISPIVIEKNWVKRVHWEYLCMQQPAHSEWKYSLYIHIYVL